MEYTPASLRLTFTAVEILAEAAHLAAQKAANTIRPAPKRRARGVTLRPGAETPLWSALVEEVRPLLRKRGARALLARELGVHRMRVTEYFFRHHAMPDAERTLEILLWLGRQRRAERVKA